MAHRVLMSYMDTVRGWRITFLEADCQTPLPCRLTFGSADKIREMHRRFGASQLLEDRNALDHGISIGRGGVWLTLDDDQYRKLGR